MKGNRIALLIAVGALVVWAVAVMLLGRSIQGRILDGKTGKPVPYAFVRIGNVTTVTDKEGKYARWGILTPSTEMMASHPAYLPNIKTMVDVDFSKSVDITLTHAGYEEMLANSQIYLKSLDSMIIKTTTDAYDDDPTDKNGVKTISRNENVMVYTPDTVSYAIQSSDSRKGIAYRQEVIVVGSNPETPGSVKVLPGKPMPVIYVLEDEKTGWVKFELIERPDFSIPFPDKNPKEILLPLYAYGNSTEYEIIDDGSKTAKGEQLITCKLKWSRESGLRSKTMTYRFKRDNGNWYDIEFFDNGENPGSKPGRYVFALLDDRPGLMVQLPKEAKSLSQTR